MNASSRINQKNQESGKAEAEIAVLLHTLHEEEATYIDFDQLRTLLSELTCRNEVDDLKQQFSCLYQDYVARISGMTKAIAAVDRNTDSIAQALEYLESLQGLTSDEIISEHRKITARFRDAFPASFGKLASNLRNRKSGQYAHLNR